MKNCSHIMAILLEDRMETSLKVQDVLTKYGCHIRLRLGLHDSCVDACNTWGMLLIQLCGDNVPVGDIQKELMAIPNVKVKHMSLDF